jgi:hypothetical protein
MYYHIVTMILFCINGIAAKNLGVVLLLLEDIQRRDRVLHEGGA